MTQSSSVVTFESYRDFPGYIINLDRERWRYDEARKNLISVGFTNLNRLSAIDYRRTDVNAEIRKITKGARLERFVNDAEIAVVLSHFKAMHTFLASDNEYCFIFEDDVLPTAEFKEFSNFEDIYYGDFELLCFGGVYIGVEETNGHAVWLPLNMQYLEVSKLADRSHVDNVIFWGAHAYLISRAGAYVLLQEYKDWLSSEDYKYPHIDRYISTTKTIRSKMLIHKPACVKNFRLHDYCGDFYRGILFQNGNFDSTIVGAV